MLIVAMMGAATLALTPPCKYAGFTTNAVLRTWLHDWCEIEKTTHERYLYVEPTTTSLQVPLSQRCRDWRIHRNFYHGEQQACRSSACCPPDTRRCTLKQYCGEECTSETPPPTCWCHDEDANLVDIPGYKRDELDRRCFLVGAAYAMHMKMYEKNRAVHAFGLAIKHKEWYTEYCSQMQTLQRDL